MVSYLLTKIVIFSSQYLEVAGKSLASVTAVMMHSNPSFAQGLGVHLIKLQNGNQRRSMFS
jgi:hypothetical protein